MLTGNKIPPGGEGKVAVNVSIGTQKRRIRQVVQVKTNDPEYSDFPLTVFANVLVDIEVLPNNVLRFRPNQADLATVTIKNYSQQSIQLSNIDSSTPHVNISLSAMTIPPQGEVTVSATLQPTAPKGILSGWLKIQTGLKTVPTLQIRLWANVQ